MNAKQVLSKIVAMLSTDKEVAMTYAKLADGTILESNTFDVGELVEVVSEDGTKSPAPDGEHEIFLKDSEGNEVRIKVMTKDGVITERENVELKAETVEVEPLPITTMEPKENEVAELASIAGEDIGGDESSDEVTETPDVIPADDDKVEMKKMMDDFAYRISEMEKKIEKMAEAEISIEVEKEEEDLPKLDGAPVEESMAKPKANNFGKKVGNSQTAFLSKLYK
jgi:hypothetical protein